MMFFGWTQICWTADLVADYINLIDRFEEFGKPEGVSIANIYDTSIPVHSCRRDEYSDLLNEIYDSKVRIVYQMIISHEFVFAMLEDW
jgi:hypothetical protein